MATARAGAWHLLGAGIGLIRYATFVRWCLPGSIWHLLGGVGTGLECSIC